MGGRGVTQGGGEDDGGPRQILRNVNTWQVVLAQNYKGFACSSSHLKAMVAMKSSDRWTRTGLTEKLKFLLADGDINGVI